MPAIAIVVPAHGLAGVALIVPVGFVRSTRTAFELVYATCSVLDAENEAVRSGQSDPAVSGQAIVAGPSGRGSPD